MKFKPHWQKRNKQKHQSFSHHTRMGKFIFFSFFILSQAFSRHLIRAWCSIKLKRKGKMIFILDKTSYKISEK